MKLLPKVHSKTTDIHTHVSNENIGNIKSPGNFFRTLARVINKMIPLERRKKTKEMTHRPYKLYQTEFVHNINDQSLGQGNYIGHRGSVT